MSLGAHPCSQGSGVLYSFFLLGPSPLELRGVVFSSLSWTFLLGNFMGENLFFVSGECVVFGVVEGNLIGEGFFFGSP